MPSPEAGTGTRRVDPALAARCADSHPVRSFSRARLHL